MNWRMLAGVSAVACLCTSLAQAAPPARLYVATNGNDAWSGKLPQPNHTRTDGPYATIDRARREVRRQMATTHPKIGRAHV